MMLKDAAQGPCMCFDCWETCVDAMESDTSPSTVRFVQAQKSVGRWKNITLDVGGNTDRFVFECL